MKFLIIFIFLLTSCATKKVEPVPKKVSEPINTTANKIIPRAKLCFNKEYEKSQTIIRIVDVHFDIHNNGEVTVTKVNSKSKLSRDFKRCIKKTYQGFMFSDPMIKRGKKIKFKQTLEFKSVKKG